MFSQEILQGIEDGTIVSRRQVYRMTGGRTRAKRVWLDKHGLLVPKRWSKNRLKTVLRDMHEELGRLPMAQDDWGIARAVQNHFGSWNAGLRATFGEVNMNHADNWTKQELIDELNAYIDKHGHYPLREDMRPSYNLYYSKFGVDKWSQVLALGKKAKFAKHGFGNRRVFDGRVFLSHQEYLIARWLVDKGIVYEKEVPYGNSEHIFDFWLPELNVYIEYYGIGTEDYKSRVEAKRMFYDGRKVIEIFKHDNTIGKLALEVQRL